MSSSHTKLGKLFARASRSKVVERASECQSISEPKKGALNIRPTRWIKIWKTK
jgi:hypothetical protein